MIKPKLTPSQLRHAMHSAAKCDSMLTSEDWLRVFQYEPNWCDGVAIARYDNGGGDHVFALFTDQGQAIIKGFDHESAVSPYARDVYVIWPGMYDGIPPELFQLIEDESFEHEDVTFACWSMDGKTWESGSAIIPDDIDDGSAWLLAMTQMNPEEFIEWGRTYYEEEFEQIGVDGVQEEFKNLPRSNT